MTVDDLVNLQAFAMVVLGLSRGDYWACTAAEFRLLVDAHERVEEHADRRVARVLAMLHNLFGRRKGQGPVSERDYLPRKVKPQSPDEMRRVIHQWHALLA